MTESYDSVFFFLRKKQKPGVIIRYYKILSGGVFGEMRRYLFIQKLLSINNFVVFFSRGFII